MRGERGLDRGGLRRGAERGRGRGLRRDGCLSERGLLRERVGHLICFRGSGHLGLDLDRHAQD